MYVVSVGLNAYYSATPAGLATEIAVGPLRSVADGQNGVHSGAAGLFPTQSFNSGNYFIDVLAAIPPAAAPPTVTQTTPAAGATGVGIGSTVRANFSRAMDASTITGSSFTLTPQGGSPVAASLSYDSATNSATLLPSNQLATSTQYTATVTTGVKAADGVALASAASWTFTTSSSPCPCSLFPASLTPSQTNLSVQDGRTGPGPWSYEMGVKITVTQPMELSAIRFYKAPLETGTHIGRVWTASGTQLAQTTFQNETSQGWQQQTLASPLILQPGTVYVVSVGLNAYYSATPAGLATEIAVGPLRSVADGQNGVYAPTAGDFPTQSFNNASYFVDLVATES